MLSRAIRALCLVPSAPSFAPEAAVRTLRLPCGQGPDAVARNKSYENCSARAGACLPRKGVSNLAQPRKVERSPGEGRVPCPGVRRSPSVSGCANWADSPLGYRSRSGPLLANSGSSVDDVAAHYCLRKDLARGRTAPPHSFPVQVPVACRTAQWVDSPIYGQRRGLTGSPP